MAGSTRQEWLNANAHRAFPFEENGDFSCAGGGSLPLCAILDARVCSFSDDASREFRLSSVEISGGRVKACFVSGDDAYVLYGNGCQTLNSDEMSFRVTFCSQGDLSGLDGRYVLVNPPRLLPGRVMHVPHGIGVDTLECSGSVAVGTVRVADGHNTELDVADNSLRLRIVSGGGRGPVCPKPEERVYGGSVLYYLNGQKADSDGSIWITGSDGVTVTTGEYRGIPAVFVSTSAVVDNFMYR